MEVHFTPEQEARLTQMARRSGIDPEHLVKDAALQLLEEDARFRAGVRRGIEQADGGEFIEEEEMDSRIERMLDSRCASAGGPPPQRIWNTFTGTSRNTFRTRRVLRLWRFARAYDH